jgi:quercetin dioxygenase-like cupin family protein
MIRKTLQLTALCAALSAALSGGAAFAAECPADKRVADGKGQPMADHAAKGVTDKVITSIDLSKEQNANVPGRLFRARRLDIAPGGIVPWHSHGDRPAMILITEGEIVEYASTCAVPILHKAGDVTAERNPTSHWWKNEGKTPVVIYSFDLFRSEDKKNEKMM